MLYNKSPQAFTKVKKMVVRDFPFADDSTLNGFTQHDMQTTLDRSSAACDNFDLTISTMKTEVMHQPTLGTPYLKPSIAVNGQVLQAVDKFTYLGSTLSRAVHFDDEVNSKIAKAD